MTTAQDSAYAQLPADAVWSCSFGNPGNGGFVEYWRTQGAKYVIRNGSWDDGKTWTCTKE